MRPSTSRKVLALAAGGTLALALAACGGQTDDAGQSGGDQDAGKAPLVFGTTDAFGTVDPAGSYDNPGWEVLYNSAQTLLSIPPGGSEPKPDAAQTCEFTDPKTYTCTLRKDLTFSDGSALTSKDVKFSFDRMLKIADPNGPSSIFADQLDSTEAKDELTAVFHLKFADATWPYRLTTAAASIVPDEKYPADKLQPMSDKNIIGSGPYKVTKYDPSQQIVLDPNENYTGDKKLANGQVLVQIYKDEKSLKAAVESGEVQVAYRTLTPTLLKDLEDNGASKKVKVVRGDGTGIQYVAFNTQKGPFAKKEVRQAAAALLDRKTIASQVYNDTVSPLYTMVPKGLPGHVENFKTVFGEQPDLTKAKSLVQQAGVTTPISAQLWYSPDHYGEASADMFAEIKRQLEDGGLFKIELKSASWEQYKKDYAVGAYDGWQLGWYPDFPDTDNYLSPFYAKNNFIGEGYGYSNPKMDELLTQEKSATTKDERQKAFEEIQTIAADDVPVIPLWQDSMIAAVRDGVTGVEDTFDPLYTFRFWLVDTSKAQ
ncbi:ABC transporter substrate-binding protein [Actinopolymorpha pittospori]|uniref:Peptide/nickel transport system substrate-binding protein n=1 Tax=Actinopolymorpha pittospori TaxID=648752 RepID=A0A927N1L2_9ACTN|nr:ABC transporter substrate-binding protein [Actinopolymorpha pittospori]MBE1610616.1 peptide/nickel transport system substrate-binding protein [Actinopolymorpha pittospori]